MVVTDLLGPGVLALPDLIDRMAVAPARILGLEKGTLSAGADADVTIIDLEREFTLDPATFHSKSRNCPYAGREVRGKGVATSGGGRVFRCE